MKVEDIEYNNRVIATIYFDQPIEEGVHFYGEDENSLQIGKHLRLEGEKIKPHRHIPVQVERKETLQEVLYIKSGKVKITFYSDDDRAINEKVLSKGDLIYLIEGGHSFEFLEKTEMIEVKQGPYNPESTQRFEGR